jgi:hypothetical protein
VLKEINENEKLFVKLLNIFLPAFLLILIGLAVKLKR